MISQWKVSARVLQWAFVLLSLQGVLADQLWWERGAASWYYKDDWKGLALRGSRSYSKTFELQAPAQSGWIVVWGKDGYRLFANDRLVGDSVDGALIDDYDITEVVRGAEEVTLRLEGRMVCAEGELVLGEGFRLPWATGSDWRAANGREPATERLRVQPSHGAFHRAHNGRLLDYNDEERGKSSIAKVLARIQRLADQGLYLLRRHRPAEEILSFDPACLWRRAEEYARPRIEKSRAHIRQEAIPLQKSGEFVRARSEAQEAGRLLNDAESAISTATSIYLAESDAWVLEVAAKISLGDALTAEFEPDLEELRGLAAAARRDHRLEDWSAVSKRIERQRRLAAGLKSRLVAAGVPESAIPLGSPGSYPESPFGWLNARALLGNGLDRWPFTVAPSVAEYIDLAGQWEFRLDPKNAGLKEEWHRNRENKSWSKIRVPSPWEREGFSEDNLRSPGDCPYELPDRRTGDKPYNGFAWYRKTISLPGSWRDRKILLSTGKIQNWCRIFVNGEALSSGDRNPPRDHDVPSRLLRFGKENCIALQVYNHDNFGGVTEGPLVLRPADAAFTDRETPGPLSYVTERTYRTPATELQQVFLASALSPAVVVASEDSQLEIWGWNLRGYEPPTAVRFAAAEGVREVSLDVPKSVASGRDLAENWILLKSRDHAALIVLESQPRSLKWKTNILGYPTVTLQNGTKPVRASLLILPSSVDAGRCRFWARALRSYPVAACETVQPKAESADSLWRRHETGYRHLELGGFGRLTPLAVAPVPSLASYALEHSNPRVRLPKTRSTGYRSDHVEYRVVEGANRLRYEAQAVERARVLKGVGELFGKMQAANNRRGGQSEDVMFQRMGEWGFDHCRYAFAFHAGWDIPLVRYVGSPLLQNDEAAWRRLDELVEKCNRAGLQMMLCWFFNEDSPQKDAGGAVRNSTRYWRQKPETKKNVFELWRRIAERYADKPEWAISYDFFNEPAYMNRDHWNEIVRELTAVIRSVDKRHTIVWESADGWAQSHWCLWLETSGDPNTLYSFHHYGKHWGYSYDEYFPSYQRTRERAHIDPWLEALLFSIRHNVPIHCGEFGISMIQPDDDNLVWLDGYLAFFERFGIGWNWWNYAGSNIYRTGLAAGDRISPHVKILKKWMRRSGWGKSRRGQ